MTVADTTVVDQVAHGPDGRILLAMTEDRRYASGDAATMAEEFRQKLNAYVFLARSDQLSHMVGGAPVKGVDIRLFTVDQPTEVVLEMISVASKGLANEGIAVDWTMHGPPSTNDCLATIGRSLSERAPVGWVTIELSTSLVGDGLAGGLTATLATGEVVPLDPDQVLIQALNDLKRARWSPESGSWLTFRATITGTQLTPFFDHDQEPPGGAGGFSAADWAEELRRFPRPSVPAWWQQQLSGQ